MAIAYIRHKEVQTSHQVPLTNLPMVIPSLLDSPYIIILFLVSSSTLSTSGHELGMLRRPPRRILQDAAAAQQYLAPHNRLRVSLGLPPLRWCSTLANYAAWWANQRRGDCQLIHSNTNYGENIFWGGGSGWRPADAVSAWAAEGKYYDYGSNTCRAGQDCTHYTQMVWRRSTQLGCSRVVCNSGDTFITCNYSPHGNVLGQKPF